MAVFRASSPGRPTSQLSRYRRSHNVARTASEKSLNTRFPQISPCLNASPAGNEATLSARRRGDVPDEIERISIQVDVGVPLKASKRGRPAGIKPSGRDLEILWQVHIWMTWARYRTRSFDQLVRWACMIRPIPAADRTTLPNRLKRLHAAVAAHPQKFGFPRWVSRLSVKGRRVKTPKRSGASVSRRRAIG